MISPASVILRGLFIGQLLIIDKMRNSVIIRSPLFLE